MGSLRRLSPQRAQGVEAHLRARAEQIKPNRTPLGICHRCARIVYSGDALAMAGGYLLHGECCAAEPPSAGGRP